MYRSRKDVSWKEHDPRKIGPPCECKRRCFREYGMEKIQHIFDKFWAINDYNIQNQYIDKLIIQQETKRQRELGDANPDRNKYITTFSVRWKDEILPVCKVAFMHIHGIHKSRVDRLNKKRTVTGILIPDQRGKNAIIMHMHQKG